MLLKLKYALTHRKEQNMQNKTTMNQNMSIALSFIKY